MLKALYTTRTGGYVLRVITRPGFSRRCAGIMDSRYSSMYIKHFVKKNRIDMTEYPHKRYRSFNDFFTRSINPGARPVDMDRNALIAPCDSLFTAYTIKKDSIFTVKGTRYTLSTLLDGDPLANDYEGGLCMVFRLMPENYHHYIYPDSGIKGSNRFIGGKLHTVRPLAQEKYAIYTENSREYTTLDTDNFGKVLFMEVGALMVGRIVNLHEAHAFRRGEEKGYFEYGGSTVIMIVKKGVVRLDKAYMPALDSETELPVKQGQRIGKRIND